ncbi:6-phosphogluconolactonase [Nitrogeniibacter mangrovi]|uniref:6-phosphogluconolactonase n=1 Tax=Nitrogeniibacter mangrovi TaxID=2016596 RepID=A0A6C1B0U1_9RHOO|nr:6-phosphogluconolactonase [Nitrogeniibacter mangrovi]QID16983.1 6-phosphogluconolactonase [Nitrogeniibacter mangrovi]
MSADPNLIVLTPESWARESASRVQASVETVLGRQGRCAVMLTGGRSARRLYEAWAGLPAFHAMQNVQFFFGDERCVPPDDGQSNFGMAMETLFAHGVPSGCIIERMEAEMADRASACFRYERLLPSKIDVLLLGVGEDGHIASLFPGAAVLGEQVRTVVPVTGPKWPHERLTVTPPVIESAGAIFVLADGATKASVAHRVRSGRDDVSELPAALVRTATWLLDTAA